MGLGLSGLRLSLGQRGGGGLRVNFYVDSVGGSDANDGLTDATAFQTLGAAETAALAYGDGVAVGLVAGSEWEENIDLSTLSNVTVTGVGDMAASGLPVIRGDVVFGGTWATSADRADANTNVYSASLTTDAQGAPTVSEDGVILKWVNTVADVQATAGTFTCSGGSSTSLAAGTYTFYIHPTGSTNANSDGKVYRHSKIAAPVVGSGATLKNIRFGTFPDRNGVRGTTGCLIENCVFDNTSPIHHALFESGTYRKCVAFHDMDDSRENAIILEFYMPDGRGESCAWDRCVAVGKSASAQSQVAFGGHVSGSVNLFDTATYTDCTAVASSISDQMASAKTITRVRVSGGSMQFSYGTSVVATDVWSDTSGDGLIHANFNGVPATIDGWRSYGDASTAVIRNLGDGSTVTNSVLCRDGVGSMRGITPATVAAINLSGVVFDRNGASAFIYAVDGAGVTATVNTSDNNQFDSASARIRTGGVAYTTLAAIQGAGFDANSAEGDPGVVDPANGDFSLTAPLANGAGLERFPTYTPIPASIAAAEAWILS